MSIATSPLTVPDLLGTAPADLIDQAAEQPLATRDVAVRRAERIRAGLVGYAAMRQDIADAYAQKDWIALGHASWHEYVQREFGEQLRVLDRDERRQAVGDFRAQGMSTRQIAKATGVSKGEVDRALKEVPQSGAPERVNGSDGKSYAPSRPSTPDPQPVEERPRPPKWDPAEREAHMAELRRLDDIRSAEQQAKTLLPDVRALILTVVQGCRQGARGLVTREMVAELRRTVDLLEREVTDAA